MRILIVNANAYTGSAGKIANGLYHFLRNNGVNAKVCYRGTVEKPVDDKDFISVGSRFFFRVSVFLARLTGLEGHFNPFSTRRVIRLVEQYQPDVIQIYQLLGNFVNPYRFLRYLKEKNIPVVYSMVDEFPYMGKCSYPMECVKFKTECNHCTQLKEYPKSWLFDTSRILFHKKERLYKGFDNIVFTGPSYVCGRARESFLLKDKHLFELDEPFDFTSEFYPRDVTSMREQLNLREDDKVVVCASGTEPRKGGHYFIQAAKILKEQKDIKFVFLGYNNAGWSFSDNVIVKSFIHDKNEFAEYMSLADAYVCPSLGDTSPSVCLSALGCGTPLIGFDYGGVKDCAPNEFGVYVPIGDVNALANAICNVRKKNKDDIKRVRQYAISRFAPENVHKRQLQLYNQLLTNFN